MAENRNRIHTAIIAIGSNMGDRRAYIRSALEKITDRAGRILASSDIIETRAWGYTDQDDFLNLAVRIETALSPDQLLVCLQGIEADLDRVRLIRWGPRTIDLDIIFYDDRIIDEEDLHIPHLLFDQRRFVLEPVCQIAPDLTDPRSGRTVSDLLAELTRREAAGRQNQESAEEAEAAYIRDDMEERS